MKTNVQKVKKFSRIFKVFVSFLLFFVIWILVAPFLANYLIVEKPIEKAEAIWVLSGSSTYIERNQEAALAYKKGIAPRIFLTNDGGHAGWSQSEQRNPLFVELAKRELIQQGVPSEAIEILPSIVEGTNYEADLFSKTIQERNLKNVLLVTSAYHTRRTLWTFECAVLKNNLPVNFGIQSPPTGQQTPPPFSWWLNRKGWMMVGEEYVKMFYYWLFY